MGVMRRLLAITVMGACMHEKGEAFSKLLAVEPQYSVAITAESGSFSTLSESVYGKSEPWSIRNRCSYWMSVNMMIRYLWPRPWTM